MNKILVIGNGFDINAGLKSSYNDFIESDEFRRISPTHPGNPEGLSRYLRNVKNLHNWIDVEHELKNFAHGLSAKKEHLAFSVHWNSARGFFEGLSIEEVNFYLNNMRNNYFSLKRVLCDYLNKVSKEWAVPINSSNSTLGATDAFKLVTHGALSRSLDSESSQPNRLFNQIYSLNYTATPKRFMRGQDTDLIYLHGSLEENDIVFGVEDLAALPEGFEYLYKSDHAAYGNSNSLAAQIKSCNEIHFFGVSFGDTDDAHFTQTFKELMDLTHDIKVFFYVAGENNLQKRNNYYQMQRRLRVLTTNKFDFFKQKIHPIFVDLQTTKKITQEWITSINS